jgi:hypothetical protein
VGLEVRPRDHAAEPVIEGLWKGTIFGTVGSMIIGIGLGVIIAVMRLSTNPVLRGVSFVYTWFFRAIPRYVLLGDDRHRHSATSTPCSTSGCRSVSRSATAWASRQI